jgi:hypothetical protein
LVEAFVMPAFAFARTLRCVLGVAIVSFSVVWGCWGCSQPRTEPKQVWNASPTALVQNYADGFDAWTGHTVRVTLAPKTYRIDGAVIGWYITSERPSAIEFHDGTVPSSIDRRIVIIGVCSGYVRDRVNRGAGIDGVVIIRECVVMDSSN